MSNYRAVLARGINIETLLVHSERLPCKLHYSSESRTMFISCELGGQFRQRTVPLSQIDDMLHTPEQLDRVEKAAGIRDDDE